MYKNAFNKDNKQTNFNRGGALFDIITKMNLIISPPGLPSYRGVVCLQGIAVISLAEPGDMPDSHVFSSIP